MNRTEEGRTAERANAKAYDALQKGALVDGSPHLKHPTVRRVYEQLVERAVQTVNRPADSVKVLEMGAGDGLAAVPWLSRGAQLTAVDCSEVMLARLRERAVDYGARPRTIAAAAQAFAETSTEFFDVVCFASMLHHVPDYLQLIETACRRLAPGGCLITFQDPMRYDRLSRTRYIASQAAYLVWRLGQGNIRQGIRNRVRRMRGVYLASELTDFEEYHVVRNGVDAEAIGGYLSTRFEIVETRVYWSTQARSMQFVGEKLNIGTTFGIFAGRRI